MSILGKIPFPALVLGALGFSIAAEVVKGLGLAFYLWGRLGLRKAVALLLRPGPPLGGGGKIALDFILLSLTGLLLYAAFRITSMHEEAWKTGIAGLWAEGVWNRIWLVPATAFAAALAAVKSLDIAVIFTGLKTLESDLLAEKPSVRKRLVFMAGVEFAAWKPFGWLARLALVAGRLIPGTGFIRFLLRRAASAAAEPPAEFYERFFRDMASGTRRERVWAAADYVLRFLCVRGFMVLFYGLALS